MTTRIYRGLPDEPFATPSYLTIGNFDGVHRGHQALVESMLAAAHAQDCQAGVLTFDPHPLTVVRPDIPLHYLTAIDERIELLSAHGLDFVVVLPFTRATAATSAADFMRILVERLRLRSLWVGPDFALGRGREGTPERLALLGVDLGYTLHMIAPFQALGGPVHSSRIRGLLSEAGAVGEAAALLGRPYAVWGTVMRGAGRGRLLGYPTANLDVPASRLAPAFGIYACWAWSGARGYPAAVSIGVRPTFDNGAPSVEAYLLDFQGDLYGKELGLSFIRRLRPEQKFAGAEALIAQMDRDVAAARRILAAPPDDADRAHASPAAGVAGQPQALSPVEGRPTVPDAGPGRGVEGQPRALSPVEGPPAAPDAGAAEGVEAPEGSAIAPYWQELPHTADWAVRVHAADLRGLFARAAHVMYTLQDADFRRPITLARHVEAAADNPAELLVSWLNRLLLYQASGREMYTRFEIHDLSAVGLRATVYGYEGSPSHTEVKAATYWNLAVEETDEGWVATITFDV